MNSKINAFNSRQHMLDKNFEIFRYRDSYVNEIALHHHDFYEVYFFMSGNVTYSIESINYILEPGDILLISPMELHRPIISPDKNPYERIVLWIDPTFFDNFNTKTTDLKQCFNISNINHTNLLRPNSITKSAITDIMFSLINESESDKYGSDLLSISNLIAILVLVNRLLKKIGQQRHEFTDKSSPAVTGVLNYINENYANNLKLDDLASRFFISKYHLSHEFNRLVGTSIYRYIIQKRLIIAKQLLLNGGTPTTVYTQCGFGDYANFYRAFKSEYKISPKEYISQLNDSLRIEHI